MGDIVRICKKSQHYEGSAGNPKDIDGKIISISRDYMDADHGIKVRWNNGRANTYCTHDLKMRMNGGNHGREES